jgi:hypothetical protein
LVDPVDHEGIAGHPLLGEAFGEKQDLLDAHRRWAGDQHERDVVTAERLADLSSALFEAAEEVVQLGDELRHVLDEAAAGELAHALEHDLGRLRDEVEAHFAGVLEDIDEPAHRRAIERFDEPFRGIEEVERVGRRRRIEEDQIVAPLRFHRLKPLHRHVLVGASEGGGHVLIKAIVQNPVACSGTGGVALHELVERVFGVEHRNGELSRDGQPRRRVQAGVDRLRLARESREAQAVRQPFRGVDGQTKHAFALHRGCQSQRRRRRRFSDATASDGENHAARVDERGEGHGGGLPRPLVRSRTTPRNLAGTP